jgi:hypothetical protein
MAELPPPGSSSNKGKVYYKEKDVRAVFGHILNPRFVQRILEIIPVHNVRPGCAQRSEMNKLLTYFTDPR